MALSTNTKKFIIIAAVVLAIIILTCLYFAFVPVWCTIQVVVAFIVGIIGGIILANVWKSWANKSNSSTTTE